MSEDERKKALSKHRKKLEEKRLKLQSKIKKKEKQKNDDNIGRINPSFQSDDPKGDFYISPKENKEMMEEFSNLINKNKGLNLKATFQKYSKKRKKHWTANTHYIHIMCRPAHFVKAYD